MADLDHQPFDDEPAPARRIDTTVAHPARRYNYWLGGKDHFAADRESGDAIERIFPTVRVAALANRGFMRRAITYVAREAGVRQFLDIGTGIPAPDNTHEVAQAIAPASRVVYADNDPIVLTHARALLNGAPEGATAYIEADLREPEQIINDTAVRGTLDLHQPVALLLVAVLHFIGPKDDPYGLVARLVGALPSGSFLILSHATAELAQPEAGYVEIPEMYLRTKEQVADFVAGMDIVPPGIVATVDWRPEPAPGPRPSPADVGVYAVVARIR